MTSLWEKAHRMLSLYLMRKSQSEVCGVLRMKMIQLPLSKSSPPIESACFPCKKNSILSPKEYPLRHRIHEHGIHRSFVDSAQVQPIHVDFVQ